MAQLVHTKSNRDALSRVTNDVGGEQMGTRSPSPHGGPPMLSRKFSKRRSLEPTLAAQYDVSIDDVDAIESWMPPVYEKPGPVREALFNTLKDHFLFGKMHKTQIYQVVDAMNHANAQAFGDGFSYVMREGEVGNEFFVVGHGTCDVVINGEKVGEMSTGDSFGELALMHNSLRDASVRCATSDVDALSVWALHRSEYRKILAHQRRIAINEVMTVLKRVSLLEGLTDEDIRQIARSVTVSEFANDERILTKGDEAMEMFIIKQGAVRCVLSTNGGTPTTPVGSSGSASTAAASNTPGQTILTSQQQQQTGSTDAMDLQMSSHDVVLGPGEWFGERALLYRDTRACDVFAIAPSAAKKRNLPVHDAIGPSPPSSPTATASEAVAPATITVAKEEARSPRSLRPSSPRDNSAVPDAVICYVISAQVFEMTLGHRNEVLARMHRMMKKRVCQSVGLLRGLSKQDRDALLECVSVQQFNAGDVICTQGAPATHLFAIKVGAAKVATRRVGGSEDDASDIDKSQWFACEALSFPSEAIFAETVVCDANSTEVFVISRADVVAKGLSASLAEPFTAPHHVTAQTPPDLVPPTPTNASMAALLSPTFTHLPGPVAAAAGAPAIRQLHVQKLDELEIQRTLGCGSFGRVRLAVHKDSKTPMAIKIVAKETIVEMKQTSNIVREKNILLRLCHPNVMVLYGTFQDSDYLYMLSELVNGGEVYRRLHGGDGSEENRLSFDEVRFYAAQVLTVYEYIHELSIVYRDLKPENMLVTAQGYLKIIDWGFAKQIDDDMTYTACGTPEYFAPELVQACGHGKAVDLWSLGVVVYEMAVGYTPFVGDDINDRMAIYERICSGSVEWPDDDGEGEPIDDRLKALILDLLKQTPVERLGCRSGGFGDFETHAAFEGFDFANMRRFEMAPPWKPQVENDLDVSNFDDIYDDEEEEYLPYEGNVEFNF